MKNPKTTWTGIAALLGSVTALVTAFTTGHATVENITAGITGIFTGVGLIFAKDDKPNTLTRQ